MWGAIGLLVPVAVIAAGNGDVGAALGLTAMGAACGAFFEFAAWLQRRPPLWARDDTT